MERRLAFDGRAGLMFNRCLEDGACAATYRRSVVAVRDAIAGMDLDGLTRKTAAFLAPWQEMEQDDSTRWEHDLTEIAGKVAEAREFIASRPGEVAAWLGEVPSAPPGPDRSARPGPPSHLTLAIRARSFSVGKAKVVRGVLRIRAHLRKRGTLVQRLVVPTGRGAIAVCRDRIQVKRAHDLTLHCRLPGLGPSTTAPRTAEPHVHRPLLAHKGRSEEVTRLIS